MKLRVTLTRRSNRLDESVILSEGIFKSVADAFRLGDLGDKLSEYAEKNKSVLKLKIKDIEEKLKQDGIDVKAIKAYENMYVKDVMNRKEDGTFSAMIQNIIDNCNNKTEHPIARKTVCYIIIFSLLILLDYKRRYGEDVASSKEKAKMCTLLKFFMIPTTIIHYFVDSTNKFFNINKYKSFDSEKIDETVFGNRRTTTYGRTI